MAVIEFRTLGTLDLRRTDGSELHSLLAQPKRVALLAYLCLTKPRGFHRRDTLLGLFWPDADQTHARTSLRNALHVLRHSLGETALLSRGDEEIAVNFDAVWCDAVAFEEQTASEEIDGALELYRGDFLSGFFLDDVPAFERWLEGERTGLRATAARAARVAAERRELEGNLTGAIRLARQSVELTDTDERAVRRLVELLARVGDRAGALQAYENFERHLATEFDAEPSAETRTLVDGLRTYSTAPAKLKASNPSAPVEVPPSPGLSIPGYSIEGELGRGGMATVFLARDLKHDRPVAIKVLRPEVAVLLGTDRFLTEISIAARLQHPNILPLLDSGMTGGLPYYVMPHVEGETLRARLRRERLLSVDDAIRITSEIADALDYAHSHGIVHRDIKPENILIGNGHALITDFGIARALIRSSAQHLTETGIAIGTAAYMSPEQAEGVENLDASTDTYALASVLYEMLTGDPPFPGSSARAILARKAAEPAPRLRTVRESISPILERNVLKALARAPADRFRTVKEFADALRSAPAIETLPLRIWRTIVASRRSAAGALVGSLVLIAILGISRMIKGGNRTSQEVRSLARQVTYSGRASRAAISPDGQFLAYMVAQGDSQRVLVQDLASGGTSNTIATITETTTMEWSPNGTQILFGSFDPGRSRGLVFTVPRMGGERQTLGLAGTIGANVWAYWLPDSLTGNAKVSLHTDSDRRLLAVDLRTEDTVPIPVQGDYDAMFAGAWSPRGNLFAVAMKSVDPVGWEIGIVSREGRSQIGVRDSIALGSPRWSLNSDAVYYTRGTTSIWRLPVSPATGRTTGAPKEIGRDLEILTRRFGPADFAVTRDGRRMAYARGRRYSNIWMIGGDHRATPVPLTSGTALRWSPVVSPDGMWLAFVQETSGEAELFRMPIEGGPISQLTFGGRVAPQGSIAWSPDGESIAYGSVRAGRSQIWLATVESGHTRPLGQTTLSPYQGHLSWAPGPRIAYLNPQQNHIQLVDPNSGGVRTIVPSAKWSILQSPEYAPDGKSVAAAWNRGAGDFGVWIFDAVGSTPPKKIADGWLWPSGWSADGRYVYASLYNLPTLYRLDTRTKKAPEPIVTPARAWRGFEKSAPVREMQCSPAGRLKPGVFVCTAFDFVSDIWIIDNFGSPRD